MTVVRRLLRTDEGWRTEVSQFAATQGNSSVVTVDTTLLPPSGEGYGFWTGHCLGAPGHSYVGWGPAQDTLLIDSSKLLALPKGNWDSLESALLIPSYSLATTLQEFTLEYRASIIGAGLLADVAKEVSISLGLLPHPALDEGDTNLLIDAGDVPGEWGGKPGGLPPKGTVVLLVPPWSRPVNLNFYRDVHLRSLRVVAKRWHTPPQSFDLDVVQRLRSAISAVTQHSRWLRPFDPGVGSDPSNVWRQVDWKKVL